MEQKNRYMVMVMIKSFKTTTGIKVTPYEKEGVIGYIPVFKDYLSAKEYTENWGEDIEIITMRPKKEV